MLQSQIINVLPRRILAGLWASPETRVSLSHFASNKEVSQQPAATSSSFLSTELPVRYTHILRLLSTLSPDTLQSPIIRNVAHSYLRDICTLLHPSLNGTSPRAFSNVLSNLRASQATNLVRLRYALLSSPTASSAALMENISTIGFGIHLLLDQHLSWEGSNSTQHAQKVCPQEVAHQAVADATQSFSDAFGGDLAIPSIDIKQDTMINRKHKQPVEKEFVYIPSVLHRVLYESTLLSLKAQAVHNEDIHRSLNWFQRRFRSKTQRPLSLRIFGGPTSIGFRLDATAPLLESDLLPGIPRDPIGIPTCGHVLSGTGATTIESHKDMPQAEWESFSGWRSAKLLASHWGGNLDAITVDGLGSTIYLALDRDPSLLERYPSRHALAASSHSLLRHHRRTSAVVASNDTQLSIQAAATQLDAFLYAISDSQQSTFNHVPLYHDHSVSLTAAVGHA